MPNNASTVVLMDALAARLWNKNGESDRQTVERRREAAKILIKMRYCGEIVVRSGGGRVIDFCLPRYFEMSGSVIRCWECAIPSHGLATTRKRLGGV